MKRQVLNTITSLSDYRLPGFPERMAIIDSETTGGKATYDRITELAIILVDEGKVVEVWQSLINPQRHIPPWITRVTGISNDMVEDQPTFETLWSEIEQRLQDRVLVAHNARFDYGFLKNEAERIQQPLNLKTLCSVKLSRYLYPQYPSHGLDAIIQRLGVSVSHRHRALDDAMVIVQLFQVMTADFNADDISKACQHLLKRPALPSQLDERQLLALPEQPGVYYFYNDKQRLLYVGKSVNIRARVLSHFYSDYKNAVDHQLSHQLHQIRFELTPTDFGAQLLESQQVKALSPSLNRRLKKTTKLYQYKLVDDYGYYRIDIQAIEGDSPLTSVYGLFRSRHQAIKRLEKLVQEHGLCQRLSGLDKRPSGCCFAYQLKKCQGACCHQESPKDYNQRVLGAMKALQKQQWPFSGPILVEETNQQTQQTALHLVHDWCYLGQVNSADEAWSYEPLIQQKSITSMTREQSFFDLDTYFILVRFLLDEGLCQQTGLKIRPLTS
ncbi:MAG: exonuclease domain-containing protein [Gammaproteobacteria bacterium]|nr:exonuclease domain-containing protein [Gammaproteobacteria bacterium]